MYLGNFSASVRRVDERMGGSWTWPSQRDPDIIKLGFYFIQEQVHELINM